MFRAIIVVFGRNKVRKGNSKRKEACWQRCISWPSTQVGGVGGRPLCILVVETLAFSYILHLAWDSRGQKKKKNLIPQGLIKVNYVNCHSVQ